MKWVCGVLLALTVVVALPSAASSQIATFLAPKAIIADGKVYVAAAGLPELQRKLAETASKAPEKWDSRAQAVFQNMVFVSAAQVATLKAVDDIGNVKFPIQIRPADMIAALLTWDTAIDNGCTTPARIVQKELKWSDVLLFSGDYDKLVKVAGSEKDVTAALRSQAGFKALLARVTKNIEASGRRSLVERTIESRYLHAQHFLLLVKADLLIQTDEGAVLNNAIATAVALGLR